MADDEDTLEDGEQESGVLRWMSALVVLLAVAGFFGLAWYAYKNGGEAVDEKDVELVKADTTPVKEAPANPGGMQIPNQDKTVYGLISGKTEKPVVERILPAPEEPMTRSGDTETWMRDSAKNKASGEEEAVKNKSSPPAADVIAGASSPPREQFNPARIRAAQSSQPPQTQVAMNTPPTPLVTTPATVPAPQSKPAAPAPTQQPAAAPLAPAPKKVASSDNSSDSNDDEESKPEPAAKPAEKPPAGIRVQLGSYRSQAEAESNWGRISREFSDDLEAKQHVVARADLGSKGIYYRLQVTPFASAKDAEQFCLDFVSAGQGCILTKGK